MRKGLEGKGKGSKKRNMFLQAYWKSRTEMVIL